MKTFLISLLICSSYLINCPAQTPSSDTLSETVYEYAEVMPAVEGGNIALLKAMSKMDWAPFCDDFNRGTFKFSFVINIDGHTSDFQIIGEELYHKEYLKQVEEIIKSLKWSPGKQNGKPVAVRYKIPVRTHLR